jgi:hypothetical protein
VNDERDKSPPVLPPVVGVKIALSAGAISALKLLVAEQSEEWRLKMAELGPAYLVKWFIDGLQRHRPISTASERAASLRFAKELRDNREEAEKVAAAALGLNG